MESIPAALFSKLAMAIYGGIVTALVFVFKAKFTEKQEATRERREADKKLFHEIFNKCTVDSPSIGLINKFDFHGNFHMRAVQPLESLTILLDRTDKTFHDRKLESKRRALAETADKFLQKLNNLSSPADAGDGMLNCLLTIERDDFAEISPQTQRDLGELDSLAEKTYDAYNDLLKTGRKKLRLASVS